MSEIVDRIKAYTERYGIVKLCGKIVEKVPDMYAISGKPKQKNRFMKSIHLHVIRS